MATTQTTQTQKTTQSKQEILVVAKSLREEIAEPLATLKSENPSAEDVEKALTSIRDSVKHANEAVPTTSQVSTSSTTTSTGNPLAFAQNGIQSGVDGVSNLIGQGQTAEQSGSIEEIDSAEQKNDEKAVVKADEKADEKEGAKEDEKEEPASNEELNKVGEVLAGVVEDVNKAVDGLTDDLKKLPIVGALIGEIDDGLKTLLFGVEIVLKGVLQVVQGLLSGLTGVLGGVGGSLLGGLL
ncbi:hypothetical protein L198_03128 [Cryptococcus wingfieldii CBS 7118]|uniref:DUF6987 domain-containing protein n=1 Tax=Cryptococcus wingfieldii CBS 7118 TaxID=1295528 RepID=A0A1E3JIU0_9TREE|nr:hypothetical protein L198_03128 [Cryptococcus wingfieldii CBS 7118]ODO00801.1 hypothetical protein L198_03128 [Cryptococcus wingfieldii CBS 7118]